MSRSNKQNLQISFLLPSWRAPKKFFACARANTLKNYLNIKYIQKMTIIYLIVKYFSEVLARTQGQNFQIRANMMKIKKFYKFYMLQQQKTTNTTFLT